MASTSSATGVLGPYFYPPISSSDGANTQLNNNVWNPGAVSSWSQTLTATTPGSWNVVANIPTGSGGAVVSYPDVQQLYDNQPLSNFSALTCTFTETMNSTSGSESEAAFDCWFGQLGAPGNEIMVWVDNHGMGFGSDPLLETVTLGGINYKVYKGGGSTEYIYSMTTTMASGTVDLLAVFNHAYSNGYITSGNGLTAIEFGWEIATTNGLSQTFTCSQFEITETLSPGASPGDFTGVGPVINAEAATVTVEPLTIGDLILLEVINWKNATVYATALSSSNVTWTLLGHKLGSTNPYTASLFAGVVTSTSSATVTPTWSGTTPATPLWGGHEFECSTSSWALDVIGYLDSGGTSTWASLTPAAAGELYFGYAYDTSSAAFGTTSGYVWKFDEHGNGLAFSAGTTSSAQAPVWGDAGQQFGIMALMKALSSGTSHTDTASLTVTPSLSAEVPDHTATASLTVTPELSAESFHQAVADESSSIDPYTLWPNIVAEIGLTSDNPTQLSTSLVLGDAVNGKLDNGTLGASPDWSAITGDIRSFTINRPMTRLQGPLWNYQAGTCSIVLDNSDGTYDPDNLGSVYAGNLLPMVPIRFRVPTSASDYPLWFGYADGWLPAQVTYQGEYAELTLNGTDATNILNNINLPALGSLEGVGADTGARVSDILTRAGWYTSGEWNLIDTGNSLLQGTTLGDTAWNLMQIAVDSEIGQLYIDGSGAVVFRARQSFLTDTRSNTVQAVFGDLPGAVQAAGTELAYSALARANDATTLVNDVQATRVGGTLQEVQDAPSVAKYLFPRTYERSDLILQTDSDALNWAQFVVAIGRNAEDRFDTLTINPLADPDNLWPQVLGREIGDRIQIWHRPKAATSPITKDCFITGITHTVDATAPSWSTTWTLQDASKYGSFMVLGNSTLGQLDNNALAF